MRGDGLLQGPREGREEPTPTKGQQVAGPEAEGEREEARWRWHTAQAEHGEAERLRGRRGAGASE
jgi:hypothetical protein